MSWYCDIAPGHPVHGPYHDQEYGVPESGEAVLMERLALEIMQAGLSWEITLKKRPGLYAAFKGFAVDKVARMGEADILRLLGDASIIRNRRKIEAIIENAKRVRAIRKSHGGLAAWIEAHHPLAKEQWVKLFRQSFVFMGGEVVNEFLMSIGYLPGAHREDCPAFQRIAKLKPRWMDTK